MKKYITLFLSLGLLVTFRHETFAQNVGIGTVTPAAKLHILGSADASQLIIDANAPQTNINPLLRFRKSTGIDLMWLHSDDSTNVFLGLKAGRVNVIGPQGINNTFIGSRTGYSNTNGRDNTALGTNALLSNTKGSQNTAIGTSALFMQSFSPGGAFIQTNNVAVGFEALYANQPTSGSSGVNNTAVGMSAMHANTIGASNTATGGFSLYLNTMGNNNTAVGYTALNSNTTASENTAVGKGALLLQSFNNGGTAWVSANVAVGFEALYSNQPTVYYEGIQNTAIGHTALRANTTGFGNTGNGYNALLLNTTGFNNSATGSFSLWNNITGYRNTANGDQSLYANTTGSYNTGYGESSLSYNTTGSNNTAVGYAAYLTLLDGQNTTCLGAGAGADGSGNNRVQIGNASVSWIGGQVGWSTYSDSRIKDNVEEDVPGLDFINRLRPVTYHLNIHRENEMAFKGKKDIGDWDSKYDIEKTKMTGFLAQDVEQAALAIGYDFSGIQKPNHPDELYSLRYSEFVVPLVKAVQEQQAIIEDLKKTNQDLLHRLEVLEAGFQELKNKK